MFIECKEDEQEEILEFDKPPSINKCVRFVDQEDNSFEDQKSDNLEDQENNIDSDANS